MAETNLTEMLAPAALQNQSVLVLGLGESGVAMATYLDNVGARVRVVDTREQPPGLDELQRNCPAVDFACLPLANITTEGLDCIAWSPGISNELGDGKALYQRAGSAGLPVVGELDLFVAALAADNLARVERSESSAQLLAVTGTNGKTTVTELTGLLAQAAGRNARVAGNIGPSMLQAWCEAAEGESMPDLWVLELSSFQLALSAEIHADAAVILNISQDHLDWHNDMAGYIAAKHRIVSHAAIAIGSRDDDQTIGNPSGRSVCVGSDEPSRLGDLGIVHEGGMPWLAMAAPAELPVPGKRPDPNPAVIVKRLMPADALRIRGSHNHQNALAALALCLAVEVPMAAMLHALRDYKGQAHRCELVAIVDDVEYYNDSKGTNVGATVAALNGLGKRSWLIAGGIGKDQNFDDLVDAVRINTNGVLLFGQDADKLDVALQATGVPIVRCDSLAGALALVRERVRPGQAVLLSPACASFDQFDNYRHRGDVFRDLVQEFALEAGCSTELPC
jgi:UDP-N-acetylmuramoylalanine--D-glutamate ligase